MTVKGADHYHFCDGVELLHSLHEGRNDPRQSNPARPYGDLLPEAASHRALCGLTTAFLCAFFAGEKDPTAGLTELALAELEPSLTLGLEASGSAIA